MRDAVLVAVIASTPPTLAAVLGFVASRAAMRHETQRQTAATALSLHALQTTVNRVETTVERIDVGLDDLRERVARLEGANAVRVVG